MSRRLLARSIKYDRKGWIKSLTIRPQQMKSLDFMADLVTDTIKELALELARIEKVRDA